MTPTTRGYPVPLGVDSAGVPADMLALAEAVDSDVGGLATTLSNVGVVATLVPTLDLAYGNSIFNNLQFSSVGAPWTDGLTVTGASGYVTVPTAGRYNIRARINWVSGGGGARQLYLMRNIPSGATYASATIHAGDRMDVDLDEASSTIRTLRTEATLKLAANETIHAVVWQNSGGTVKLYQPSQVAYNSLQIIRLS